MKGALLAAALLCGCDEYEPMDLAQFANIRGRLDAIEVRESSDGYRMDRAERSSEEIETEARLVVSQMDEVTAQFQRAGGSFDASAATDRRASELGEQAIIAYQNAATRYRQVAALVIALAVTDVASQICDGVESTQHFRRRIERAGGDLRGQEVNHSMPANPDQTIFGIRGANHRWNYQLMSRAENQSLSNHVFQQIEAHPLATVQGFVVSALVMLRCRGNPAAFRH